MIRGIAALCASVAWMGASAQSVNDTTAVIDSVYHSLPDVMVSGRRPVVNAGHVATIRQFSIVPQSRRHYIADTAL